MLVLPIGTDRPQRQVPWVNILLIAANVILYFASQGLALDGSMPGARSAAGLASGWDKYMLDPLAPKLYQFFTYQFLHMGGLHILMNMVFLYIFGNALNEKLGHAGYLMFYLTGGVLAGCGHMFFSTNPTLGASGSISAVTGMFLAMLPRTEVRLFVWFFFFIDRWEIPSMYVILFSVARDVLSAMLLMNSGVAYGAHLSGNVVGFAMGMGLLMTGLTQRDHYDFLAMVERWRRRKAYESVVAQGWNAFDPTAGVRAGAAKASPTDSRMMLMREEVLALLRAHDVQGAAAKYLELRKLDGSQGLPPQEQLDVSNQLMLEQRYVDAADAYETYLKLYPTGTQVDETRLILGLIYGRYHVKKDRAIELLTAVYPKLHNAGQQKLAADLLRELGAKGEWNANASAGVS